MLKQYLPLCWFKINPLELKNSLRFFRQNIVFYLIVQYILQANMTDDFFESFWEVIFEVLLMLIIMGIMLQLNHTQQLFLPISTAVLFCANVVSVLIIPVIVWLTLTEDAFSYYASALLVIWYYSLLVYIMKHVFRINVVAGAALALFYFLTIFLSAFGLGQLI